MDVGTICSSCCLRLRQYTCWCIWFHNISFNLGNISLPIPNLINRFRRKLKLPNSYFDDSRNSKLSPTYLYHSFKNEYHSYKSSWLFNIFNKILNVSTTILEKEIQSKHIICQYLTGKTNIRWANTRSI